MPQFIFAETNKAFVSEKILSAGFALMICVFFSPSQVLDTYILLGHAHFMLSHLYLAKAGKANPRTVILFFAVLAMLFVVAFYWPQAFTLFVASFLVFHVYTAEVKIVKRRLHFGYFGVMIAIMMLNGAWLSKAFWGIDLRPDLMSYFFLGSGGAAGLWYVLRNKIIEIDALFVFLVAVLLAYIGLELTGHVPSPYKTYGFIVITHYMTFYVLYLQRFSHESSKKLRTFLGEIFIMNIVMIIGYVTVYGFLGEHNVLYKFWYMPVAFYVWTLMHFLSTLKRADYKGAFSLP